MHDKTRCLFVYVFYHSRNAIKAAPNNSVQDGAWHLQAQNKLIVPLLWKCSTDRAELMRIFKAQFNVYCSCLEFGYVRADAIKRLASDEQRHNSLNLSSAIDLSFSRLHEDRWCLVRASGFRRITCETSHVCDVLSEGQASL